MGKGIGHLVHRKTNEWDDLGMQILQNPTPDQIKMAASALSNGQLVAFPTETVYGLGADATNEQAVKRIFKVKGRPTDHPLIVHISSIEQLTKWAIDIPDYAIKLAKDFWPGPMTLIFKKSDLAVSFVTGGQDTVGLRIPDHTIALSLLNEFEKLGGLGICAPSANKFGAVSPTYAKAVFEEIGRNLDHLDLILDGGFCKIGIESTIIDCISSEPVILRSGAITDEHLTQCLNLTLKPGIESTTKHSGNFQSHYAPKAGIIINQSPRAGDGLIALSEIETPDGVIRLCSPKNNDEYAHQLYSALRKADNLKIVNISVFLPDRAGIGNSIIDRINKAAAKPTITSE
jgi:L-threonylcarbamoyladenylate synthase